MRKTVLVILLFLLSVATFLGLDTENGFHFNGDIGYREVYYGRGSAGKTEMNESRFTFNEKGEAFFIADSDFCLESELKSLDATVLYCEKISGGVSYYAYSDKIKKSVTINGRKINVQIFIKSGYAKVGTPLIYGGY